MILLRAAFTDSDGVFYNYSDEYSYRLLFRDVLVADRRRRDVYHLSVVRPCPTCDHLTGMSATRLDLSGGVPRLYSEVSTFVRPALLDGVGCLMKGRLRFTADLTDVFRFLESEAVPCTKRKQELIAMLPPMITISVIENGTRRPAPSALRVTVDGRTLDVPAMESTFEFPDEVVASGEVLVEADLGDEILRIPRIHGSFFRQMDWTIRLGNRADAESYDWPTEIKVPKLSSTCMIDFNAAGMDPGRQMSVTSCRRPKR